MPQAASTETLVMSVPEAGAKLGLGRNASYAAAQRGDLPTIRIGKLLKVPKAAFENMLTARRDNTEAA
jgi:excisionase family DNA binding protein